MNAPCRANPARVALFTDEARQQEARRVCQSCPLVVDCRADVLRLEAVGHPVHGVAGGLLPSERPNANREGRTIEWAPIKADPRCGTYAGARHHERNREPLCRPCLEARREQVRTVYHRRRGRLSA